MIAEILSIASVAGGAYLLSKNNEENKVDDNGNDKVVKDVTQTDYSDSGEGSETEETNTSVTEPQRTDPRSAKLYFGDASQEYDPFYDYTGSAFDEYSLNALTYTPSAMGQALRVRFIAPALLSTDEVTRAGYNRSGTEFCRSMLSHEYKNSSSEIYYFACARKIKTRSIAFVLEVFNPFEEEAQLQKIVFNDIRIGNTRCMVMANYGIVDEGYSNKNNFYHSARECRLMDENGKVKLRYCPYEYIPGSGLSDSSKDADIKKGYVHPYSKDRHYCTIPARSSVFIKVPLNLVNYDKIALELFPLSRFVRVKSNGSREWVNENLAKKWGVDKLSHYSGWLPERGVESVCFMNAPAAPSLRNDNLSMKLSLYSNENNFIPKDDIGRRTARAEYGATFDLRLIRGNRPENFTYKWEDSYMGDANLFPTENDMLMDQETEFQLETGFDLFQESQYYSDLNGCFGLRETVEYETTLHEPLIEQYGLKKTNI